MKILFLTKEPPYPPNNGHRIRSLHLLKGLCQNHQVHLICFKDDTVGPQDLEVLKSSCTDITLIPDKKPTKDIRFYITIFFKLFSLKSLSINRRYSSAMKQAVKNILSTQKVDLIVCDGIHLASHIPEFKRQTILSEHNIESEIVRRYYEVEKNLFKKIIAFLEWKKLVAYENKTWPKFNQSFSCSQADKDQMQKRCPGLNVSVIPNGVDIHFYAPGSIEKKPYSLIYTGLMNWHPNEDAVLYFLEEIYPLIKHKIPAVNFWIVGNKPSGKIIEAAKKDPSVTVTGFVQDVRPLVHQSAVFVVPLRIGSGTRLKILEALSMEKAIVSTSIGAEGLDVTHGKDILLADNPENFANAVIHILNGEYKNMEKEGRRLVEEKYSWEKVIQQLNQILQEIK